MRPIPVLASILALAALFPPPLQAQSPTPGPPIISGAGLVDFSQPSRLKVGQWANYRITTVEGGVRREATQKVSIEAFEIFGGERCAWIESRFSLLPSALLQRGVCLEKIFFVEAGEDSAWAAATVLRAQLFPLVVYQAPYGDLRELRRFQLLAGKSNATMILLGHEPAHAWPIRLSLEASSSGRRLSVVKGR